MGEIGPTGCPRSSEAIRALPASGVTLDGEAVVCDARGVSDFDALRSALAGRGGDREVIQRASLKRLRRVQTPFYLRNRSLRPFRAYSHLPAWTCAPVSPRTGAMVGSGVTAKTN
jgi:hypothetical protein